MVGFKSKRIVSMKRHCDDQTMDYIIELKKQLLDIESQLDNALNRCEALEKLVWKLRALLEQGETKQEDEERNC